MVWKRWRARHFIVSEVHGQEGQKVHIYSLISEKGGAGKSTLTRQLAVLAGETEPSILIERDPQRTTRNSWTRPIDIAPAPQRPCLIMFAGTALANAAG